MERPTVLLATADNGHALAADLARAGFDALTDSDAALASLADGGRIDLAVIDCDLPAETSQKLYAAVHGDKTVPTLLLFGDEIPEFATASSATRDEYAVKPIPSDALVYRLQALLIRSGMALPGEETTLTTATAEDGTIIGEGRVVSIFAPKGGVGKTTVSVNIAVALREQTHSNVLLFDADVGVGNVTSVLAVKYRMGLADLADSPPEEWTDSAFEHCVATHEASGVRVLTWGSDPAESEQVGVDLLLAALRWAKAHHSYVVVDTHPGYDDRTMAMLAVSNEIFLVVTPEVGALRNSAQFLELARELGLGNVVRVIVNRANHGIRAVDMSKTLGLPISATIVSNGPKAVIASNEGRPVILRFPREKMSDDLHAVARLVVEPEHVSNGATAASGKRGFWTRFGTRTSQA
jgi:pilus assembly protein CpaE